MFRQLVVVHYFDNVRNRPHVSAAAVGANITGVPVRKASDGLQLAAAAARAAFFHEGPLARAVHGANSSGGRVERAAAEAGDVNDFEPKCFGELVQRELAPQRRRGALPPELLGGI